MSSQIVKRLLHEYVNSMYQEGFVNSDFCELLHLSPGESGVHLVQKIDRYCIEVDSLVSELDRFSNLTKIDFYLVAEKTHLIEEKSACIGALHVINACMSIHRACEKKHNAIFSQALGWLKNEFASTRKMLETCAKIERKIIRLERAKGD